MVCRSCRASTNSAATAESVDRWPIVCAMRSCRPRTSTRARQTAISLPAMVTDPAHVRMAAEWAATSKSETTGQALMEVMTTDLRPEMSRIRVPVLLIAPDTPAGSAAIASAGPTSSSSLLFPTIEIVFVPNARHFVLLDDPAAVLSAINAFLN